MQMKSNYIKLILILLIPFFPLQVTAQPDNSPETITLDERDRVERIDGIIKIDKVWAGHPVGFCLLTHGDIQYIAYYNADRHMVVGQRNLQDDIFDIYVLPPKERTPEDRTSTIVGWDSHNGITMAVDDEGYIHLAGNMHVHPLTYFRSTRPNDISTLSQIKEMTGREEDRCTYPNFMKTLDGELVFHYRDGGSGRGNEIYNIYSTSNQKWSRLLDSPLLDGQGEMNAYASQPRLYGDGWYHMYWVWRDTPDCETNHDLSYVKSPDLINWFDAFGDPLELPITFDDKSAIVDPIPAGGGIINLAARLCLDEDLKPVMAYHKYDEEGNLQFYIAQLENNKWSSKQITNWDYRWEFTGRGSINNEVRIGPFTRRNDGYYELSYSHIKYGEGTFLLDSNLDICGEVLKPEPVFSTLKPEGDFPGLLVRTRSDIGNYDQPGNRYILKWETLVSNRDRPHPEPWPEPSQLYLYKLKATQSEWQEITSVEDAYSAYPERMHYMLQHLDLELKGLEKVKKAYEAGDFVLACEYLLYYYSESQTKDFIAMNVPGVSSRTVPAADSIIQGIHTYYRTPDRVTLRNNGHIDWFHNGPEDDIEWAWALNRHFAVVKLLSAWIETGNPKYARFIDRFVKDWIISSWPYPEVRSSTAMWRGLEVSFRVKFWAQAFHTLKNTGYLTPATQLLILSSLPDHAHYARNFHAQGNWLTMEISGLSTVAASWPEFKESEEWINYSINVMTESMKGQVYPDGVQTELTSSYHQVSLSNFSQFMDICNIANVSLPDFYTVTVEDMWNYLAATMRPDGHGLLNNNADLRYNRESILNAASGFDRGDWEFIATNGTSGSEPEAGPSFLFPWAGHLISRSGYGPDAHWSFFDIGPWGSGHQHNDKLHLSVAAYGRDLLVDAGRFAYRGEIAERFRPYALSSQSHNLILIDGKGQGPGPRLTSEPLPEYKYRITDDFDYASASFENFIGLEGDARHTRSLLYVRGEFWVVVDHLESDRPRKVEALWHWHPDCQVHQKENGIVASLNQRGNLKIIPAGTTNWKIDFVIGQEEPVVQGWYSREYNSYESSTAAIYSTRGDSGSSFAWVLFPYEKDVPEVNAEILSREAGDVKIRVSVPGKGYWDVSVPFLNSAKAGMEYFPY